MPIALDLKSSSNKFPVENVSSKTSQNSTNKYNLHMAIIADFIALSFISFCQQKHFASSF